MDGFETMHQLKRKASMACADHLSHRTVNKHLEQIYAKLGVE
jgi:DNA-binding CsgD family transcriptional regulator